MSEDYQHSVPAIVLVWGLVGINKIIYMEIMAINVHTVVCCTKAYLIWKPVLSASVILRYIVST